MLAISRGAAIASGIGLALAAASAVGVHHIQKQNHDFQQTELRRLVHRMDSQGRGSPINGSRLEI